MLLTFLAHGIYRFSSLLAHLFVEMVIFGGGGGWGRAVEILLTPIKEEVYSPL